MRFHFPVPKLNTKTVIIIILNFWKIALHPDINTFCAPIPHSPNWYILWLWLPSCILCVVCLWVIFAPHFLHTKVSHKRFIFFYFTFFYKYVYDLNAFFCIVVVAFWASTHFMHIYMSDSTLHYMRSLPFSNVSISLKEVCIIFIFMQQKIVCCLLDDSRF